MEETGVLVNLDLLSHCYPTLNQARKVATLCHFLRWFATFFPDVFAQGDLPIFDEVRQKVSPRGLARRPGKMSL
jgi:hypothetical protein